MLPENETSGSRTLAACPNSPQGLVEASCPVTRVPDSEGLRQGWESAFLTGSQDLLLVQGPHLESHQINDIPGSLLNFPVLIIKSYVCERTSYS